MNYIQGVLIGGIADGRRVRMHDVPHLSVMGMLQTQPLTLGHDGVVPQQVDAHHYEVFWGSGEISFLRPAGWTSAQAFAQLAKGYGPEVVQ